MKGSFFTDLFRGISRESLAPLILLVLGNLLPVIGVVFLGWEVLSVLILYWLESLIIGFFYILRILISGIFMKPWALGIFLGIFLSVFFIIHYGIFMLVHLFFLLLLGSSGGIGRVTGAGDPLGMLSGLLVQVMPSVRYSLSSLSAFFQSILLGVVFIFFYAASDFITGFLASKQYRKKLPMEFMMEPYGRIFLMQVTIIVGGGLIMVLRAPSWMLIFFVLLKTLLDIRGLNKSRMALIA